MASPGTFPDPAFGVHDLHNEQLELAYEEGHDADIPSNIGVYTPPKTDGTMSVASKSVKSRGEIEEDNKEIGIDKAGASSYPTTVSDEEVDVEAKAGAEEKEEEEERDPNIVWWDEPADQDPANPMNWSEKRKWGAIAIISVLTLVTPLASSMFAPGVPQVMRDFESTNVRLATFVVSVYILGFAFGPLIVAPLSEMYGRLPLYNICNWLFFIFTIACALASNLNMLIGFRFLAGTMGAVPLTLGGGTIADLMPAQKRGGALAIWAMGPLMGPIIGPIAGGFLVQAKGWRWVFWVLAMLSGVLAIFGMIMLQETYAPVLLEKKTRRLRKETGNQNLKSKLDSGLSPRDFFTRSIVRPTKMLLFSPIVAMLSTYVSVTYGILYLLFTTFTYVFMDQYGFSEGVVGLAYIGIGIGMLIGLGGVGTITNKIAANHSKKGDLKPEHRLPIPITVIGGLCLPIGLLIYGWTADKRVHWFVPIFGTSFVGLGLLTAFMTIQTYLVDAFTLHAASATAANTVLRSLFGALLPLCGLQMYDALGLGWGNSVLALVALLLIPLPVLFRIFGERIRTDPRFQLKL